MLAGRAGVKRATVGATTFMARVCILATALRSGFSEAATVARASKLALRRLNVGPQPVAPKPMEQSPLVASLQRDLHALGDSDRNVRRKALEALTSKLLPPDRAAAPPHELQVCDAQLPPVCMHVCLGLCAHPYPCGGCSLHRRRA